MEISLKPNEASRDAAESAPNSLLKVEISCSLEDSEKYAYYRFSKIVGGTLYLDKAQQNPITDKRSMINSTGLVTTLWFAPHLYTGVVPSFVVEQISNTTEVGASMTMTLNLLDPQPRDHVSGV